MGVYISINHIHCNFSKKVQVNQNLKKKGWEYWPF